MNWKMMRYMMMMNGQYIVDKLIDHVWLIIYNENKEKNEIINTDIDKDKDMNLSF